jgi:dienelactone hydrolase
MTRGRAGRSDAAGARVGPEFRRYTFTHDRLTHEVFRGGAGPAVLVLHEIPGLHPGVIELGRRLVDAGYSVYLPSLFGRPAAPPGGREIARSIVQVCVSREFTTILDRTSPVVGWVRALAASAYRECGGPGVGVAGMCLTGGFALATALEPSVVASVVSQPALPAPVGKGGRAALGLDADDLTRVAARTHDGLRVLGLRFTHDRGCPPERFETLRTAVGTAFESFEIDSSPGNAAGIAPSAHAVLTVSLVDRPGHPTRVALDRVLSFLAEQLRP